MTVATREVRANALRTTNGFWWADLSSTDDAGAAEFYGKLLGWSYDEMPIGEGMVHRNARIGDHMVAGIDPVMPGSGMPSAWTNFIFIDDINASLASAVEHGATVIAEPMDVMGEGHMAVFADPTGTMVGLWQPGRHRGADAVNQPGTYIWVELATSDLDRSRQFYTDVFGWDWERLEGDFPYWLATLDGRNFAGAYAKMEEMGDMPDNWATYFGVADINAAAETVRANGGTVIFEPKQMGPGVGIAAIDPQGAFFMVMQMNEWPED